MKKKIVIILFLALPAGFVLSLTNLYNRLNDSGQHLLNSKSAAGYPGNAFILDRFFPKPLHQSTTPIHPASNQDTDTRSASEIP